MPATPPQARDIRAGLRAIVAWAKSPTRASKVDREKVLLDALEAALREIESTPNSLAAWILGALHQSMHKPAGMWIVKDRALFDDAMDAIAALHERKQAPAEQTQAPRTNGTNGTTRRKS